jgi:tetratricopeptide (TPR) repeat protein
LSLKAEERALAENDAHAAGRRAHDVGWVHYLLGQAAEVLACAERTDAHWKVAGAGAREQAAVLRLRGLGYHLREDYPAAIESYSKALALCRASAPEDRNVAEYLNSLASARRLGGDLTAAERDYREALRIATKLDDREGVAFYTGNLAVLELTRQDWPVAEKLAREALALAEGIGRLELLGSACHRLAKALARQGKAAEVLPHAQRAMEILGKLKRPNHLAASQAALRVCTQPNPKPPPGS